MYLGYALAVLSGVANSFLDTSITPSCMEIFKEKGTVANIFTKMSVSIAQFLLPFAISFVAVENLPFHTIFFDYSGTDLYRRFIFGNSAIPSV